MTRKTPLECMLDDLDDTTDMSDDEITEELESLGINTEDAYQRFKVFIKKLRANRRDV